MRWNTLNGHHSNMSAEKSEGFIIWGAIRSIIAPQMINLIDYFFMFPLNRWNVWPDFGARGDISLVANINGDINTLSFQSIF